MFTVGEFAHLAQVSKRLLRYYDQIDLLKPNHIDSSSGYRYYSADQMSQLNRILALKELGFSLNQIQQTANDNISADELHEMLLLKKTETGQQLRAGLQRIQMIESRLQSMRNNETTMPTNIVIKQVPQKSVISLRRTLNDFEAGMMLYGQIQATLPRHLRKGIFFCVCHSDAFVESNLDMEVGLIMDKPREKALTLSQEIMLVPHQLPAVEWMATTVIKGSLEAIHVGYAALVKWATQGGYRLLGIPARTLPAIASTPFWA